MYAAQEIPQIDTEIAQKGHFRMETNYYADLFRTSFLSHEHNIVN